MDSNTVKNENYFLKIKQIIENLKHSGMLNLGSGYCLSMSDIVLKLLYKEGILAELVECSLMVMVKEPPSLCLVGYHGFHENVYDEDKRMENHIVCITKTKIPILIDLSIGHIDRNISYICEPIVEECSHADIAEFNFPTSTWTYQSRDVPELPKLHQKSILNRIQTDVKVDKEITFIKYFLFILFTVSSLNFVRGMYDFYYTFIHPEAHPTRYLELKEELKRNEIRNDEIKNQLNQ
jgi:hypothetical protein